MSEVSSPEKHGVFELKAKENPDTLVAVHIRQQCAEDPEVSDGAFRLFARILDMALHPYLNNGRKGEIIVSQMKLATLLNCTERSIYRRTRELKNYIWTSLVPRPGTKPIICYHVTAFQPKKELRQEVPGEGLFGNCKRRFDAGGFERTGKEATGHKRRVASLLLDKFGKPIFSFLPENTAVSGSESPVSADKIVGSEKTLVSGDSGQNCPLTADVGVRSQRTEMSADSGQNCPLSTDGNVRHIESQNRESAGLEIKGKDSPPVFASPGQLSKAEIISLEKEIKHCFNKVSTTKGNTRKFWQSKLEAAEIRRYGAPPPEDPQPKPGPARKAPAIPDPTEEQRADHYQACLDMKKLHLTCDLDKAAWVKRQQAVAKGGAR